MAKIDDIRHRTKRSNGTRALSKITTIVRHHSGGSSGNFDTFWSFWNGERGWGTGGYHEIILRDGTVQLCYDPNEITNGVKNHNSYTYHICLVGNGQFTEAQEAAWDERAAYNMQRLNVNVSNVKGHNEMPGASTACPGINMNIVRARISGGAVGGVQIEKPAPATNKLGSRILRNQSPMMRGEDVKAVQRAVGVTADGIFGPATETAVRNYQEARGLQVDGIVGPETVKAINSNAAPKAAKPAPAKKKYTLPNGVLKRGSKGEGVRQLQTALNAANFRVGTVDGDYGPKTEDAVRRFQSVHLPREVDGVYGPNTRKALDKVVN
ncbi:peptidoglycan recognition protein family protein [Shouchella clausii]|uniref:Autolysin n=1 Tax=Shouchella clausii TaxID=79880 RepID=A0A268P6E4_SHOCL|nr:N-acetylmuramoyl-L-alanine amidase [Shouchella clausii]PAE90885.1 hypothetical protein CHH72_00605 [Shouchella clausii]